MRSIVTIPSYPFQRRRYWIEEREPAPPVVEAPRLVQPLREVASIENSGRVERGAPVPDAAKEASETNDPLWQSLVATGEAQMAAGFEGSSIDQETAKLAVLNQLSEGFLRRACKQLGLDTAATTEGNAGLENSAVAPRYRKAVAGWLRPPDSSINGSSQNPTQLWPSVAELWKSELFLPQLVRQCGQQLTEVLRGEVDPLTIIFDKGSSAVMERIYSQSTWARFCNGLIQSIIRARLQGGGESEQLSLLEIGAGTGATTRAILPLLPAERTTYTFTDLGPNFLQSARDKFADYPFVQYELLDIESNPAGQAFAKAKFDIVIAANVLHATRDLEQTLRHVRRLLKPGGLLLLWEATSQQRWMDISFSPLEGWQRFEDFALRPQQPLLAPDQWLELIRSLGFAAAHVFPEPGLPSAALGQSVILARAAIEEAATSVETERSRPIDPAPASTQCRPSLFYQVEWIKLDRGSKGAVPRSRGPGRWRI